MNDEDIASRCGIHGLIDTSKGCQKCYDSWPEEHKKVTRAQCKRQNWIGRVDVSTFNKKLRIPEENLI